MIIIDKIELEIILLYSDYRNSLKTTYNKIARHYNLIIKWIINSNFHNGRFK
jgi:hypothetical protein